MAYKTTVRQFKLKGNDTIGLETFVDECLKEGTDQGWVLHKYWQREMGMWLTFIWETND
jgi:hypothetical protein